MAHAVNLRLFVCRTVRPIALQQPSPFRGHIAGISNQWRVSKGPWAQPVRAEHHEAKPKRSGVTRASASGSSFRDASDALSQAQPEKGLDATPELGMESPPLQLFLSLTCTHFSPTTNLRCFDGQRPCKRVRYLLWTHTMPALGPCLMKCNLAR